MLQTFLTTQRFDFPLEQWNVAPSPDHLWLSVLKVTLVAALGFVVVAAIGLPLAAAAGVGGVAGLGMLAWNHCCCCADGSASYFPSPPAFPFSGGHSSYNPYVPVGGGHLSDRSFRQIYLGENDGVIFPRATNPRSAYQPHLTRYDDTHLPSNIGNSRVNPHVPVGSGHMNDQNFRHTFIPSNPNYTNIHSSSHPQQPISRVPSSYSPPLSSSVTLDRSQTFSERNTQSSHVRVGGRASRENRNHSATAACSDASAPSQPLSPMVTIRPRVGSSRQPDDPINGVSDHVLPGSRRSKHN